MQEAGAFQLFKMLAMFYRVAHLTLDYNLFEVQNITSFSLVMMNSCLHTISLNYCKIGDESGVILGEAVQLSP